MKIACLVSARSDACISASTAVIHTSTAPPATTGSPNANDSPSVDSIPITDASARPVPKMSADAFENSFTRCSWTARGSCDPRMESSSSSEMKKNRGNAIRFVSRYSDSDFWHDSSSKTSVWSFPSRPSVWHASSTLVFLNVSFISLIHRVSIESNALASSGSCSRMSADPIKIDSRYIHLRCARIQMSITSAMCDRSDSHLVTLSRCAATYRDACIDCSCIMLSSSAVTISSTDLRMYPRSAVPLLYTLSSKWSSFHTCAISAIPFSIESSFIAPDVISPILSLYRWSSIANSASSVNDPGSRSNDCPVTSISRCQCRGRSASFFRSENRGIESLNPAILSSTTPNGSSFFSSRGSRFSLFPNTAVPRVSSDTSSSPHSVDDHSPILALISAYRS